MYGILFSSVWRIIKAVQVVIVGIITIIIISQLYIVYSPYIVQ